MHRLSLVVVSRGYASSCGVWISHCGSLSCCRAWALGVAETTTQETKHTRRVGKLRFTTPAGPEELTLQALSPEQRGYRVFIHGQAGQEGSAFDKSQDC